MSEQAGPYDGVKCHFCGKSAKQGAKHTAGYSRREKYATVGPWFDACESCARKPYDVPPQFRGVEDQKTI